MSTKLKSNDRTRYVIRYVACAGEYFRGPSGKYDQQPVVRTVVRGQNARKVTSQAIRDAGGRIVSVRAGWF